MFHGRGSQKKGRTGWSSALHDSEPPCQALQLKMEALDSAAVQALLQNQATLLGYFPYLGCTQNTEAAIWHYGSPSIPGSFGLGCQLVIITIRHDPFLFEHIKIILHIVQRQTHRGMHSSRSCNQLWVSKKNTCKT